MIRSLKGKITKDIANKGASRRFPERLNKRAIFLLMALSDASGMSDLKKICEPPSLKLHKLKGNLKDYWSITIEKPWCIVFKYEKGEFIEVEIGDYHD
jgi:proteic killer suppression protein